jgi:hypothetical protein
MPSSNFILPAPNFDFAMKGETMRIAVCALALLVQSAPARPATVEEPWKALTFLEGTWDAHTQAGSAGAEGNGTYTFKFELNHHVLARYSKQSDCKGPKAYDCKHSDLLYIYQGAQGQPPKAIYFDNEGHVIHYAVSNPETSMAVFASEPLSSGPQFQLIYQLKNGVMSGKFQMRMPGQADWKSYLEWSGAKH